MYLLDSSAWIEYFMQTGNWKKVERILTNEKCYASIVSISEISHWAAKQHRGSEEFIYHLTRLGEVLPLTEDIAKLSGEHSYERKKTVKKWGLLDSMIYVTAKIYGLRVVTKDFDFNGLPDVELLGNNI